MCNLAESVNYVLWGIEVSILGMTILLGQISKESKTILMGRTFTA